MCGITGLIGLNDPGILKKMNDALIHRGPDDEGYFSDPQARVSLAMRRLSIIDLTTGKQPLSNEDESIWLVANGEIYNAPELRKKLEGSGHRFKTRNSDIEVILHLYEENGWALLSELNGMFAFVLYDKKNKVIFGCRDRMGIKPFYYSLSGGKFAFASELKALLILPWVSKAIHPDSLYHYISLQSVPAPQSIFADIRKLEAGHFFIYKLDSGEFTEQRFWDLQVNRTLNHSLSEWKEILRPRLKEAVKRWTLSDVPIACSLSGGLDSSSIVAFLAQSGMKDIRTYSLGFAGRGEQGYNELPLAREVSKMWNTRHYEVILKPERVLKDLEKMVYALDEPYGGGLPSWYIYELLAKDVKVCLTGTGGDELFGNYGKWRFHENGFLKFLKSAHSFSRFYSLKELLYFRRFPAGHYYWRVFSDSVKDDIVFDREFTRGLKTEALLEALWKDSGAADPRDAVAYVDFKLQLPEEFLLVSDRFSMAHSVEARVPYLDHTLVELAYSIPSHVRTHFRDPKYLLKAVAGDLLPPALLAASKKGFVLPLTLWTRNELKPLILETLSPKHLKKQGIFSPKLYARLVKPHLNGLIEATPQVWTLFMFQLWHKAYCG